jgi:hypothetical protein
MEQYWDNVRWQGVLPRPDSIRPFLRQAGDPCPKASLSVEQPMPRICVRLAPLPQVFRQPTCCWSSHLSSPLPS